MFVIKMCSYSGDGIEMFSLQMFFFNTNVHECPRIIHEFFLKN